MVQIDAMVHVERVYKTGHFITIVNLSCVLHENKNQMTHDNCRYKSSHTNAFAWGVLCALSAIGTLDSLT